MYLTTHAAAGVLIGALLPHPIAACAAGAASHFVLDMIPHEQSEDLIFEYPKDRKKEISTYRRRTFISIADLVFVCGIVWIAWLISPEGADRTGTFTILVWGIAGGLLPDCILMLTFISENRILKWYFNMNINLHFVISRVSIPRVLSAAYQLLLACLFLIISQYILHSS